MIILFSDMQKNAHIYNDYNDITSKTTFKAQE